MMKKNRLFTLSIAAFALMLSACVSPSLNPGNNSSTGPNSSQGGEQAPARVTGVALNRNTFSGEVGDTVQLYANVSPSDAANREVTFSSDNMQVATVTSSGLVTIVGKGRAVITATTIDGGFMDMCVVTCEDPAVEVVCLADDLVDLYCWDIAEADINYDAYLGHDNSWNLYFEYEQKSVCYVYPDYDFEEVELYDVVYADQNGDVLGYCGIDAKNGAYFFEVPENLELVLVYPLAAEAEVDTNEYAQIVDYSPSCTVSPLDAVVSNGKVYGVVGSTVELEISVYAGYDFDNTVSIETVGGEEVEAVLNANGNYEFVMPNEAVIIEAGATAHNFSFIRSDEKGLISTTYVDGERLASDVGYVPCDSVVTILFTGTNKNYVVEGVNLINGEGELVGFIPVQETAQGPALAFYMPYFGITCEVVYSARSFKINLVNTDNLYLVAYEKVGDEYVPMAPGTEHVNYYETTYFKVFGDTENFNSRGVSYDNYYSVSTVGNTYKTTQYGKELSVNADGYYFFSATYLIDGEVTIRINGESDAALLEDTNLVGNYAGFSVWGSNINNCVPVDGWSGEMKVDGSWKQGSDMSYVESFNPISHTGYYTNDSGKNCQFMYRNNVLVTAQLADNYEGNYQYVFFRLGAEDSREQYEFHGESFLGGKYVVAQALREGQPYASLFIDHEAHKIYTNVTFEMVSGAAIDDQYAVYDIKLGNNTLAKVGYYGSEGKAANRGFAKEGAIRGTFLTPTGEEVVFDGFEHVTYEGVTYVATYENDVLVGYTQIGGKSTLSFDLIPELGVISNVQVNEYVCKNPLEGRTFSGIGRKYYWSNRTDTNDKECTFEIAFLDDTHCSVKAWRSDTGAQVIGLNLTAAQIEACVYSISGNVVTVKFHSRNYTSNYYYYTWNFTLSDDYMTITCTSTNRATDQNTDYCIPDQGPLQGSALNNYRAA